MRCAPCSPLDCLTVKPAFGARPTPRARWEDIDEKKGVIRIQRKQRNGVVGSVSRLKRAPREIPLMPSVFAILREH